MARVKAQHRHLCEPLHDRFALLLRDAVNVGKTELVYHVRYDRCMATLKGLVEKMINSAGSRETMYSGSECKVSAMETEMGTCSLS